MFPKTFSNTALRAFAPKIVHVPFPTLGIFLSTSPCTIATTRVSKSDPFGPRQFLAGKLKMQLASSHFFTPRPATSRSGQFSLYMFRLDCNCTRAQTLNVRYFFIKIYCTMYTFNTRNKSQSTHLIQEINRYGNELSLRKREDPRLL